MCRAKNLCSIAALAATGILFPLAAQAGAPSFGTPLEVQQITKIENTAAAQTNINHVLPYYAPNAIVADYGAPGWYKGTKEIYQDFAPQMAAIKSVIPTMKEITVAGDANFACAMMQIHFEATTDDNVTHALDLRQLDAFKKIAGHWRIIQEQISVPVNPTNAVPLFNNNAPSPGPLAWSEPSELGPAVPWAQAKSEIYSAWLVPSEIPKTVQEMTSYYGPGDDFIIADFASPAEIRGHKEMADFYGPQFTTIKDMDIKIPFVSIETDGAFGVQISEQELTLNMKDGTKQYFSFRQSDCLHRVGGKWYSFFEMGSFPVDMKTGKAILVDPAAFK